MHAKGRHACDRYAHAIGMHACSRPLGMRAQEAWCMCAYAHVHVHGCMMHTLWAGALRRCGAEPMDSAALTVKLKVKVRANGKVRVTPMDSAAFPHRG
jgi:hypothetical protein